MSAPHRPSSVTPYPPARSRARRAVGMAALTSALALIAAALSPTQAVAAATVAAPPAPPPVHQAPPAPAKPLVGHPRKAPAWPKTQAVVKVAWPAASDSEVAVSAAPATAGGAVTLTGTTAGTRTVRVRVMPAAAGRAAGVDGPLVGLTTTAGAPAPTRVRVDARAAATTLGGDWASRARLVELTGCTVTGTGAAQTVSGCTGRRTLPTATTGDGVLTATITPTAAPTGTASVTPGPAAGSSTTGAAAPAALVTGTNAVAATTSVKAAATTTGVTVLAATAGVSGNAGSYAATSLSPSSTWTAGGQNGDFTWSYPFTLPPVPGNLTPTLGVSYDSAAVDGRVASTNNQPSWVGDGFDLSTGFIERRYMGCADDMSNGNNSTPTGDLCWKSDNATISLGTRSGPLVKNSTTGTWRIYNDDGSKLTHYGTLAGAGEYWTLTTTDGTVYTFGKGTAAVTGAATNSAWTVPVFGNQSGEPNYHAGNFAGSVNSAAVWRWNLDSVVDIHGNAINYFYTPETNEYGQNGNKTVVSYTPSGYLNRIDYGLRTDATTTPGAARVVFTTAERCLPSGSITCDPAQLTAANASYWPDVPFDQLCTAALGTVANPTTGGCVNVQSPAFFTRKRLTGVTAQIASGTGNSVYRDVDRYTITQTFLDPGDGTSKILWTSSVARTGVRVVVNPDNTTTTTTLAAPTTKLQPTTQLPNRVDAIGDGAPALNRFRLSWIDNGVGGTVTATYAPTDCTPTNKPTDLANNTRRCFPVYYTIPGANTPTLNLFHKYVVAAVLSSDGTANQPDQITYYQYPNGPKWHFDRDDLTPAKYRTWGQSRGFDLVRTYTGGTVAPWTARDTLYLRGMDGDCATTTCSSTKAVTVTDSRGGTITDTDLYAGFARETRTFNGATGLTFSGMNVTGATLGKQVSETLNTPVLSAIHADDGVRKARIGRTGTVNTRTYRTDGTTVALEAQTATTYDDNGYPTKVDDAGDTSTSADDACTTTTYAADTTHWILGAVTSTQTVAKNCATTPTLPADLLSGSRTLYDGAATWSATPALTKGDATGVLTASGWDTNASALTYVRTTTTVYDAVGRASDTADALSRHTITAYAPAGVGPVASVTVTNALNQAVTTTLDPRRGQATAVTDANANTTTTRYDELGRQTGVWLPGRALTATASKTFTYTFANTATSPVTPTVVATGELRNTGTTYTTSYAYYDGLLRPLQTQTVAADGSGNRIVTATGYDARGLQVATTGPTATTGVAGSGAVTVPDANLAVRTDLTYDGAGRVIGSAVRAGIGSAFWHTYTTLTSYDGVTSTVTPPAGGTIQTTTVDARGKTTRLRQYITSSGTAGGSQDTTYTWRPDGQLASMTDPAGITWSRSYDLRGRLTSSIDPDHGSTTTSYDDASQVATVTDARNTTLAYKYDSLGRKTEEHSGSLTGTLLAAWTYDTATGGKGQPATSTRYYGGNAYTRAVTSYDSWYHVVGTSLTIPSVEGAIAGTYTTLSAYNLDGQIKAYNAPSVAGITGDGLSFGYNALGLPGSMGTSTSLVAGTTYSAYGDPLQLSEGTSPLKPVYVTYGYEEGTRRLHSRTVDVGSGTTVHMDATTYTWDDAGNLTQTTDQPTDPAAGYTSDTQCFSYDPLRHLTSAWTPSNTNCSTTPTVAGLGGPAPYWIDWTINNATGNRTTQTVHAAAGNTTTSYTYPATTATQPHTLTKTTTTPPTGGATTNTYGYDTAGNTKTKTPGTGTATSYTWDEAGRLAGATTPNGATTQLYDADGNLLITRDPTGSTLYAAPTTEVRRNTSTSTTTVRQVYTWLGQTIAIREATTAGKTTSLTPTDPHNTAELAIDATTLTPTFRRTTPYGETRGTPPSTWLGTRGFVNGIQDATTALTQLGARPYDPTLGRFLAVDPLIDLADPQQWNPYAYSNNNPATFSDPTGLEHDAQGGVGGAGCTTFCPLAPGADLHSGYPAKSKGVSHAPGAAVSAGVPFVPLSHTRDSGRDVFVDENGMPHYVSNAGDTPETEYALKQFNSWMGEQGLSYDAQSGNGVQFFLQDAGLGSPYKGAILGSDGNMDVTGTTADLIQVTRVDGRVVSVRSWDVTTSSRDNVELIAKTIENKFVEGSKAQAQNVIFVGKDSAQAKAVGEHFSGDKRVYSLDPAANSDFPSSGIYGGGSRMGATTANEDQAILSAEGEAVESAGAVGENMNLCELSPVDCGESPGDE